MKKENTMKIISDMLKFIDLGKMEIKIYSALLKGPMTLKEIKSNIKISERMTRIHIKRMLSLGIINRYAVNKKRLMYIYSAKPVKDVWIKMKKEIKKSMKDMDKKILIFI